ncbi:MAG: amidohydrolase family protein [Bacteroidia bacterium]|jgi:hypothetical protein
MKKIVTISLLLVFVKISFSQCFIDSNIVAIKNISVIPMTDTSTVLSHKTVLIQNNTITQIDDTSNVNIPSNAFVINGTGKYLIPGLCDMHAHLLQRNDAILELANGVTTVCNMHGEPWHISFRDSINTEQAVLFDNKISSPRIYSSGPIMNFMGHPFFNPQQIQNQTQALSSLQSQDSIGYDFYKTYTYLTQGVFNAIQNYAASSGKFIKGHGNDWIGAMPILQSSQKSIEHFWGYLPNDTLDLTEQALEDTTIAEGKWNCPTLIVRWNKQRLDSIRANEPNEVQYVCPSFLLNNWRNTNANPQEPSNISEYKKLLKRLYQNGAKLMLGSDNITPYSVAGFAVHKELEIFVEAGLTPHQALTLATSKPYEFLNECGYGNASGTIVVGKRADLVILNQDPLTNISNTKNIYGVIGNGTFYANACLQTLLSNVACNGVPTAVEEIHAEEEILTIYPNPSYTEINIYGLHLSKKGYLKIIDQQGSVVLESPLTNTLNISNLSTGMFYLLGYDGHSYYSQKFIKQ